MTIFAGVPTATGAYNVAITGPGNVLSVVNPSEAPQCQFACYDIEVVSREAVARLYNIPGQNQNKSQLTTPPAFNEP